MGVEYRKGARGEDGTLVIFDDNSGERIVVINVDGTVELKGDLDPKSGAYEFWNHVANFLPPNDRHESIKTKLALVKAYSTLSRLKSAMNLIKDSDEFSQEDKDEIFVTMDELDKHFYHKK